MGRMLSDIYFNENTQQTLCVLAGSIYSRPVSEILTTCYKTGIGVRAMWRVQTHQNLKTLTRLFLFLDQPDELGIRRTKRKNCEKRRRRERKRKRKRLVSMWQLDCSGGVPWRAITEWIGLYHSQRNSRHLSYAAEIIHLVLIIRFLLLF